jgi:hypothetical protein
VIRSQETGRDGAETTRSDHEDGGAPMSQIIAATRNTAVNLPTWVWLAMMLAVGLLYAVTFDGGLLSSRVATSSMFLHEFFHDGRHLLGVPCH